MSSVVIEDHGQTAPGSSQSAVVSPSICPASDGALIRPVGAIRNTLAVLAMSMAVASCGGGGGDSTAPPPTGPSPAPTPTPGPGPAPVSFPADCAAPATSSVLPGGSEAPSQIGTTIDAYSNCDSVYVGQNITFHLSDHAGSAGASRNATVTITRIGSSDQTVYTGTASMSKQVVPNDAWVNCCNWPTGLTLQIPANWTSGFYRARFDSPSGGSSWVAFVVKHPVPGSVSNLVMQVPFDTSQMYNGWGGKSAYTFNSTGGDKAEEVSRLRPSLDAATENHILGVIPMIRWAESQGITMEYISGTDMHADSDVLAPYKVFLTVGHDEYWSTPMRQQLDAHIDSGRHAVIFSGNSMWWRTEPVTDVYGRSLGKLIGNRESGTSTANWLEFDPEARTIGATFFKGGYVDQNTQPQLTNRPYTVYRPNHWAFANTGLSQGGQFGASERIHRYESDGIDLTFVGGLPQPTGSDGAPTNTEILALADLSGWDSPSEEGPNPYLTLTGTGGPNAAMTAFTRPGGGIVFNGGTTDFYQPLPSCTGQGATQKIECKIFKNVLDYLQAN